ncbi:MAG: outer membrane protein assembly factor BamA [Thermodesulfovibrionales bacterium]|nr:outer membrane protein assembly factor BamA [Thermodesulfovibrionales bacterium]
MIILSVNAYCQEIPLVTDIQIKGIKRIDFSAIRAKLSQKTQEVLSTEKVSEDIKAIYKMGYFDDVKVDIEPFEGGVRVVYIVKEKPTIVKVEFQGNKNFEDNQLKEKIGLLQGAISDVTLIHDNAMKIKAFYEDEGYYLANVIPVVKKLSDDEVSVTFFIEENKKVKIRQIIFEGNKNISASKLKSAMQTTERGLFSWITGKGYYKKHVVSEDIEKIKNLYFDNGYIKVTVAEPVVKISDDKESMTITISLTEGEQYSVKSVGISGNKNIPNEDIKKLIKLPVNKPFSKSRLQSDISAITDAYFNKGYALVSVNPDVTPDDKTRLLDIVYKIDEGDKFRIGRIDISGNVKTEDKVIRREMRLDEGDVFNGALIKRSYERLNNLQYFDPVEIIPKPNTETKLIDIDIKVKEKPTGFLSIGGGYSSVDKLIGMVDITQGNFLGKGYYLKARGELGGLSSFYELSFRNPYFMDKPISFGTSIYRIRRDYPDYSRRSTGFEVSFGRTFWEYWGASIAYNLERTNISDINENASIIIKEQEGTKVTSSVSLTVGRDTRDNNLDPIRGSRNSVSTTFAGLGGSNAFFKILLDSGWYFPVYDVTTIHLRGRLGLSTGLFGKKLPLYERYYVGGITTVRGVAYGEAGPKDPSTGDAIGGEREIVVNAEYIFPIVTEYKFKGLVFFDAGRAYDRGDGWGKNIKLTSGFGIRWISPMGPLRVEWGYNLNKKQGESTSKLEFTFGTFF